jgi:hypothetical protein
VPLKFHQEIHSFIFAQGRLFGLIFPLRKSGQEKNSLRPLRLCGKKQKVKKQT